MLAVLASGEAMTAGDIAKAARLQRNTVATALSRLVAQTGIVEKAQRGYHLSAGGT